jgi:recombination protein RecA
MSSDPKRRRLETAAAALQQRYGPQALRGGDELSLAPAIPHVPTGFPALDACTGCEGVPLGLISLFSGRTTAGKLTLAYQVLANAQRSPQGATAHAVALVDLSRTADPDHLARCGVDLEHLVLARPPLGAQAVDVVGDLVQSQRLRAVVVDSLVELGADPGVQRHLRATLGRLQQTLRLANCALVLLDEPKTPWARWLHLDSTAAVRRAAALHVEMQREQWLRRAGELAGYRAQARLLKSRWVYGIRSAPVEILFDGTPQAPGSW